MERYRLEPVEFEEGFPEWEVGRNRETRRWETRGCSLEEVLSCHWWEARPMGSKVTREHLLAPEFREP
jgi:hypothetical protein